MTPSLVKHIDSLQWLRSLPGKPLVVAEIKRRSPFNGWVNSWTFHEQLAICEAVGDIISCHTSPLWGGSWDNLSRVRFKTKRRVLAKGYHPSIMDVQEALDLGADCVLTLGWDGGALAKHCWYEVESRDDLVNAPQSDWIVLNSRNPRTGEKRTGPDLQPARVADSVDRLGHRLCQASNIQCVADVALTMDAILIGQGLYE